MKVTMSPSDFQGSTEVPRTSQEPRCFTGTTSLSPGKPIPGSPSLTKKRDLFPGLPPTSPSSFALPHMARKDQTPMPGSGILTRYQRRSLRRPFRELKVPVRSHLGRGFPLRCFQRLSCPNVATGQCHWHDNPNTSGSSTPVLSY